MFTLVAMLALAHWPVRARFPRRVAAVSRPSPARIISLIPAVTEMLFAIGAGPAGRGASAATTRFRRRCSEAAAASGALLDPDLERILSLKPDLVVVYESQVDLEQQLARAASRCSTTSTPGSPT